MVNLAKQSYPSILDYLSLATTTATTDIETSNTPIQEAELKRKMKFAIVASIIGSATAFAPANQVCGMN